MQIKANAFGVKFLTTNISHGRRKNKDRQTYRQTEMQREKVKQYSYMNFTSFKGYPIDSFLLLILKQAEAGFLCLYNQ